jgi:hypothetical protein
MYFCFIAMLVVLLSVNHKLVDCSVFTRDYRYCCKIIYMILCICLVQKLGLTHGMRVPGEVFIYLLLNDRCSVAVL